MLFEWWMTHLLGKILSPDGYTCFWSQTPGTSFREIRINERNEQNVRNAQNNVHLRNVWKCYTKKTAKDHYKKLETREGQMQ